MNVHANFLRARKPTTQQIRELIVKVVPERIQLFDSARRSYDNMRYQLMSKVKNLAKAIESQMKRCWVLVFLLYDYRVIWTI